MSLLNSPFYQQARLVLQVLPTVAQHECFALKGGTAINLFVRDLPRLSVDIDLVYVPIGDRQSSLRNIGAALRTMHQQLQKALPGIQVIDSPLEEGGPIIKLLVQRPGAQIKIEVSPVLRGTVFKPEKRDVTPAVEAQLGYAACVIVSVADLYGGKLCAALDRQHPRDLFDVNLLYQSEGLQKDIFRAFLVYLISSNRPIAELLDPRRQNIQKVYNNEFKGMTLLDMTLAEMLDVRERLIADLQAMLSARDKAFLLSFKRGEPAWDLLGLPGISTMPAVIWKLQNLTRMDPDKKKRATDKLAKVLKL